MKTLEKFQTSIAPIDHEHELLRDALVQIKKVLLESGEDKVTLKNHLDGLASKTKNHFRNEEVYLLINNCSPRIYEEHRVIHSRLEIELETIILNPENRLLYSALENWFLSHLSADKELLSRNIDHKTESQNAIDKNKSATKEPRQAVPDSTLNYDWNDLFSTMNKSPFGLMFADRDLTLRHANPVAMAILKAVEHLFPTKAEQLIGQSLGFFHRWPETIKKITGDIRNLPYHTQIIIGPKTLDLQVRYAHANDDHLGFIVHWTEITEL